MIIEIIILSNVKQVHHEINLWFSLYLTSEVSDGCRWCGNLIIDIDLNKCRDNCRLSKLEQRFSSYSSEFVHKCEVTSSEVKKDIESWDSFKIRTWNLVLNLIQTVTMV